MPGDLQKPPVIEILSHRTGGWHQQLHIEILSICCSEGTEAFVKLLTKIVKLQEINKPFPLAGKPLRISSKSLVTKQAPQ